MIIEHFIKYEEVFITLRMITSTIIVTLKVNMKIFKLHIKSNAK